MLQSKGENQGGSMKSVGGRLGRREKAKCEEGAESLRLDKK